VAIPAPPSQPASSDVADQQSIAPSPQAADETGKTAAPDAASNMSAIPNQPLQVAALPDAATTASEAQLDPVKAAADAKLAKQQRVRELRAQQRARARLRARRLAIARARAARLAQQTTPDSTALNNGAFPMPGAAATTTARAPR
jgi:hypothetical protein